MNAAMTGRLEVGSRIGGYVVTGIVGHGGMATVYAAEAVGGGPPVALKVMEPELTGDEGFRRRFLREPGYVADVAHPNLMPIYDFGEVEGALYLSMPLVRGSDLHTLIAREGPLEVDRALSILAQVAAALDALHATGVLHRDVKPGNVMVASRQGADSAEHAYLTDFGLGKDPYRDSAPLTGTGQFVGTADYSAPEQIMGGDVDGRADAYSLACTLVEALTGRPPFPRVGVAETLQAQVMEPPPLLDERRPELPPALNPVLARALAKHPSDRFESCHAFLDAAAVAAGLALPAAASVAPGRVPHGDGDDAGVLRLRVISGNAARAAIRVQDELLIGRQAEAIGRLSEDVEMSRRHAHVRRGSGRGWVIADLGSRNGTYVNGRRIDAETPLRAGDTVDVGETTLFVEATEAPEGVQPARRVTLRLELDFAGGVARVSVGEQGDPVRVMYRDAAWRLEPDP